MTKSNGALKAGTPAPDFKLQSALGVVSGYAWCKLRETMMDTESARPGYD